MVLKTNIVLFSQFKMRKMMIKEVLLDTSFVWGWFENAIKTYRASKEKYAKGQFDITKKMKFLLEAKFQLLTTNIAKAEVFRKLLSEKSVSNSLCRDLWTYFVDYFSIHEVKVKDVDFDEVAEMCLVTQLSKGSIPNLIQLQFSKKNGSPFATGDNTVRYNFRFYFENIFTYVELREIFDSQRSLQ